MTFYVKAKKRGGLKLLHSTVDIHSYKTYETNILITFVFVACLK